MNLSFENGTVSSTISVSTVLNFDDERSALVRTINDAKALMTVILAPPILVLGTFGNIMIIVILYRMRSKGSSMDVFFFALAISDTCLLYVGLFNSFLYRAFGINISRLSDLSCKLSFFIAYTTGVLSAWLLVAMTTQRAASVIWPHRVKVICTRKKSQIFAVTLTLFFCVLHSHLLYGLHLVSTNNNTAVYCSYVSDEYNAFIYDVWSLVDLLISSFIPFIFLAVSNLVLIWKLTVSVREANTSLSTGRSELGSERKKKVSSITVTLVVLSLTFLILSGPYAVYILYITYFFPDNRRQDDLFRAVLYFVSSLLSIMWNCNSAVNFYLYCLTGTKFRENFKQLFCPVKKQSSRSGLDSSTNVTQISGMSKSQDVSGIESENDEF